MGTGHTVKTYAPHLTVMLLAAAAWALVLHAERAELAVRPPRVVRLPAAAGAWSGEKVRFCQDALCSRSVLGEGPDAPAECPACGGVLGDLSPQEQALLPADTLIDHRLYRGPGGATILAALVVSGAEQSSIHRPQQCLPAQGLVIEGSGTFAVPVGRGGAVRLMGLSLRRPAQAGRPERRSFFAYWFFAGDRATPFHLRRLAWMARDRVLGTGIDRWAYVSLLTDREARDSGDSRIGRFMADFYPALMAEAAAD